jgi:hypothetical protein
MIANPVLNKRYFYYLLLLAFSSFGFFRPVFIEDLVLTHLKNFYYDILLVLVLFAIPTIGKFLFTSANYLFSLPIKLIGISIVCSMMMAYFFWGQGLMDDIFSELPIICYLFYFFLMGKGISTKSVERIIIIIGICYTVFYLVSFAINPIKLFEYKEAKDRDFLRIFLFGDGFLFLFYFLSLNKIALGKSKIWLLASLASYLCIILNQTRVYMISTAIITVVFLLGSKKLWIKFISISLVVSVLLIVPQLDYVKNLQKKTQSDLKGSDDYIRIKAAKYYLDPFQPSTLTRIFGNGFAIGNDSYFSKVVGDLQLKKGYYTQDIGLIGLYVNLGIASVVAFLIIFIRAIKTKLKSEYVYLKMFIVFLMFTCLTTDSTFSSSYIMAIVFTLYLFEHCRVEAEHIFITTTIIDEPTPSKLSGIKVQQLKL